MSVNEEAARVTLVSLFTTLETGTGAEVGGGLAEEKLSIFQSWIAGSLDAWEMMVSLYQRMLGVLLDIISGFSRQ